MDRDTLRVDAGSKITSNFSAFQEQREKDTKRATADAALAASQERYATSHHRLATLAVYKPGEKSYKKIASEPIDIGRETIEVAKNKKITRDFLAVVTNVYYTDIPADASIDTLLALNIDEISVEYYMVAEAIDMQDGTVATATQIDKKYDGNQTVRVFGQLITKEIFNGDPLTSADRSSTEDVHRFARRNDVYTDNIEQTIGYLTSQTNQTT